MSSNYGSVMIADVKTEHINHYLIFCMMEGNKARTRNNDLAVLRTLFGELVDQKLVQSNPCSKIKMLYTKSETHVAYTDKQVREIRDWLKENQPYTYFFCKFIAHPFLRLKETRKLRVRDIDFDTGIVTLTAKTSKTQKKIKWLSKDLMRDIKRMEIQNYPEHYFVFSSEQCPGEKQIGKSYFSKRFRKVKKIFGLSRLHTMYGLRHSIVSQLLRNGAPWHEVMKHTGHTTMAAFQKYARSLGTEEPKDLSEFVSVKF